MELSEKYSSKIVELNKALMDFIKTMKIKTTEVNEVVIPEAHKSIVRERVATYDKSKLMSEIEVDKKIKLLKSNKQ